MSPELDALVQEARHPATPFERLEELAEHPEVEVRRALLDNPNVCPTNEDGKLTTSLLVELAKSLPEEVAGHPLFVLHALIEPAEAMRWVVRDVVRRTADAGLIETLLRTWGPDDADVRQAVAKNPSTPEDTLRALGNPKTESEGYVRIEVASNPTTPEDTVRILGNQKTESVWYVRQGVAANPTTPPDVLRLLGNEATESVWNVRRSVAENPTTPLDTLRLLGNPATESKEDVRVAVARNPNTPQDTLRTLGNRATEPDWEVRASVAQNPNTPQDTLRSLGNEATESEWYVRDAAQKALVKRGLP